MTKKRTISVLLILVLASILCFSAAAYDANALTQLGDHVIDEAGILTEDQIIKLESKAAEASDDYGCGIYMVTVNDYRDYAAGDVYDTAKDVYRSCGLGWGSDHSGVMLFLSMAERDYALIAYGYGNTAFTDYGMDYLSERFLDDFSEDAWYDGILDYIRYSSHMLQDARDGKPVDKGGGMHRAIAVVICVVIGFLVAFFVQLHLKRQLKSVAVRAEAEEYITEGGLELSVSNDQFVTVTQTRVYQEPAKSSGGTTIDSSGFSGKSGKF